MTRRPLSSRLALAMALVAVVSAVLAGVLAAPLLRSATDDAVRQPLGQQADLLARLPRAALFANRVTALTSAQDLSIGVVTDRGVVRGAAVALPTADREALLAGGPVSTTGRLDGADVLIEARPARVGGAVVLAATRDSVDAASTRLRGRVLLALGLGLLAALLTAVVMARRLGDPLARTAAAARRMAAGERGVTLPDDRTQEVADVAEALAHLDRALTTSERRQRQFLMSVSHELRTPLTTVRGYAEALADGEVEPDELRSVGRTLLGEAERLQSYVEELLGLARLEADDFALHLEPVDVVALVRDASAVWQDRCRRSGLDLAVETPEAPLPVHTDPARLRQVIDALTDNAVRVCVAGETVVLAARRTPEGVQVEVRDSGPGLTEDDAGVAFEPGVLHARYAGSRPGGHGLGLAIVARLVDRLGGTMAVSRAPEGGARFAVDLPVT
ncbi:MAG: HAMP domain-containing sensor histidine kinase [Nocardioidaceae bacterium]